MKKLYVMCPAYLSTGGTELLHQLVYKLIHVFKIEAYIFYPNVEWKFEFKPTPTKFIKYIGDNWVDSVEDIPENIIIIPETYTKTVEKYHHATLWIWWLSIDNFFITLGKSYTYFKYIKPGIDWRFRKLFGLKPYKNLNTALFQQNIKLQLYQSEYARVFLKNAGSQKSLPLSDYIVRGFISKESEKDRQRINQVVYNPIKGLEITTQLINSFPEIVWVPIIKMKPEEVSKLLTSSKVYVDFGNHPGKDRIPREAVLNGCCIIINKQGAAANSLDIDIPSEFKIADPIKQQDQIILLIKKCFNFYDDQYLKFGNYLNKILMEEKEFEKEISVLVKYIKP